eukprot:2181614-Amphidinium_carterae.2
MAFSPNSTVCRRQRFPIPRWSALEFFPCTLYRDKQLAAWRTNQVASGSVQSSSRPSRRSMWLLSTLACALTSLTPTSAKPLA